MSLPSTNPDALLEQLETINNALLTGEDASLPKLSEGLNQLVHILASDIDDNELDQLQVGEISEFGTQILSNCRRYATDTGDKELQHVVGLMGVSVAIWVCDHGGEVTALEPVVDTLAWLANNTHEQNDLVALAEIIKKIIAACSRDLESTSPWRIINMNYAIVATRSHDPEIMETAFQTLIQNLPEDVPGFFAEGMAEIERQGYPDPVRKVMERYFEQWNEPNTMH